MKSIAQRVKTNITAYHLVKVYGAVEAASKLKTTVDNLMARVRGAEYYQAHAMNFHIMPKG